MKTRPFFSILTAIILVLLLAGGAGAYWLATRTPVLAGFNAQLVSGEVANPSGGMFISRQSPLVISLLANPDRLAAANLATIPASQRRAMQSKWRQLEQALLAKSKLDYTRDIRPWLGDEITFAVTNVDLDRDDTNGQQPGYLLAATVKDADKAQQSLQAYWQKQAAGGKDLVFEQLSGVQFVYATSNQATLQKRTTSTDSLAPFALTTAVVGDRFVLLANHPKVLRDAINNLQVPELSLDQSEVYQQSLQQLTEPHVGMVFVHLPQLAAWLRQPEIGDLVDNKLNAPSINASSTFDSLVMAINLRDGALLADTLLLAAPDKPLQPSQPQLTKPAQALQYVPATSPLVATGVDLSKLSAQLESGIGSYTSLAALIRQPIAQLEQQWDVDLFGQVLSWMQGEYALAKVSNGTATPDWIVVTERSSETDAELAELDSLAQQQDVTIGKFMLGDQPVSAWIKLSPTALPGARSDRKRSSITVQADVRGVHTTLGNYEIFATSLDAISQAIEAAQQPVLAATNFDIVIDALPTPNDGYLYINGSSLQQVVNRNLATNPSTLVDLQPFLDEVNSLTLSSYGTTTNAYHSKLLVQFKG